MELEIHGMVWVGKSHPVPGSGTLPTIPRCSKLSFDGKPKLWRHWNLCPGFLGVDPLLKIPIRASPNINSPHFGTLGGLPASGKMGFSSSLTPFFQVLFKEFVSFGVLTVSLLWEV